jgi:hypothetical protein
MRLLSPAVALLSLALTAFTLGCGKSDAKPGATNANTTGGGPQTISGTDPTTVADTSGPVAALTEFLNAVRTGNDAKATQMLSTIARQKATEASRSVGASASDTAKFELGQVEMLGDEGARIQCTWTDMDEKGTPQSDKALWVLRHEQDGWRVAGVAAWVFPGEDPLLFDFEKPEEMEQKQQWLQEELVRRSQPAQPSEPSAENTQTGEKSEKSVLR